MKIRLFTLVIFLTTFLIGLTLNPAKTHADEEYDQENEEEIVTEVVKPTFPSCEDPEGAIKVTYSEGIHGVPGDSTTYNGRDTVYTLSEDALTQCLCIKDDGGIQTNWWKVSSLSERELEILVNEGWIYVPNGALWGLDQAPYMAHNSQFDCGGDDDGGDGEDKNDKHDAPRGGPQEPDILGISTKGDVLGLAATGNIKSILVLVIAGSILIFLSLWVNKATAHSEPIKVQNPNDIK